MLRTTCSHCSKLLGIPREAVGKKVRCAACQTAFDAVPNAEVVGPLPPPPVVAVPPPALAHVGNAIADRPMTVAPAARGSALPQPDAAGPLSRQQPRVAPHPRGTPWGLILGVSGGAVALIVTVVLVIVLTQLQATPDDEFRRLREGKGPIADEFNRKLDLERQRALEKERFKQDEKEAFKDFRPPDDPPPPPPVPRLAMKTAARVGAFSTAVVSADSGQAVLLFPDGKLSWRSLPGFEVKGNSNLGKEVHEAVLDRRGMLYTFCATGPRNGPFPKSPRDPGGLAFYDLGVVRNGGALPARLEPTEIIPLNAVIEALLLSPDQQWLYFLDSRGRRLGRLSVPEGKVAGECGKLPEETKMMCLTPDGKRLFACTTGGELQEFDPLLMVPRRTWSLNRRVADIQATDAGLVFLIGADGQWTNVWRFDTVKGGVATDWAAIPSSNAIKLSRDQKRLFVSCWRLSPSSVTAYWVADAGPRAREAGGVSLDANFSARGRLVLSRDGRFLLCDSGHVLQLGE